MATAAATTTTVETAFRVTLAATCPSSTVQACTGSERSRSTIPLAVSAATATAVEAAPNPVHSSTIPGTT